MNKKIYNAISSKKCLTIMVQKLNMKNPRCLPPQIKEVILPGGKKNEGEGGKNLEFKRESSKQLLSVLYHQSD